MYDGEGYQGSREVHRAFRSCSLIWFLQFLISSRQPDRAVFHPQLKSRVRPPSACGTFPPFLPIGQVKARPKAVRLCFHIPENFSPSTILYLLPQSYSKFANSYRASSLLLDQCSTLGTRLFLSSPVHRFGLGAFE